jgi:hypothetical protein
MVTGNANVSLLSFYLSVTYVFIYVVRIIHIAEICDIGSNGTYSNRGDVGAEGA